MPKRTFHHISWSRALYGAHYYRATCQRRAHYREMLVENAWIFRFFDVEECLG